ncbi:hypothetical protein ES705_18775 [subsurface metagenome]
MAHCDRISKNCENKCYTIWDTNSFIFYMKYLSYKYRNNYYHIRNEIKRILDLLSNNCWVDNAMYCSSRVLNREYMNTLFAKVPFLNNLNRNDEKYFKTLFRNSLINTTVSNETALDDFYRKAETFRRKRQLSEIDRRDLSLYYIALEGVRVNPSIQYIIVTGDDSFYEFILESQREGIQIEGYRYDTSRVFTVSLLAYFTPLYECCLYNELKELRYYIVFILPERLPKRVKERKYKKFLEWNDSHFALATLIKEGIIRAVP